MRFSPFALIFLIACSRAPVVKDDSLARYFHGQKTPAYALRKIQKGHVVSDQFGGRRAEGLDARITSNDRWHLGACGQSMTAFLVGILIDQGKLKWDSTVGEYFGGDAHTSNASITVQDLLAHQSGLKEVSELSDSTAWLKSFDLKIPVRATRDQLALEIVGEGPAFTAGSKYSYANSNYVVLGSIIEKASGKDFEAVMREKLFTPLAMNQCDFGPAATRDVNPPDGPWGHFFENGALTPVPPLTVESEFSDNPRALAPAGTVSCSFESWSAFLKEMLASSQGKSRLLARETAEKLFTPYKGQITYGGLIVKEKTWAMGKTYIMVGSNTLNYALYTLAPEVDEILMGATNSGAEESLTALNQQIQLLE